MKYIKAVYTVPW